MATVMAYAAEKTVDVRTGRITRGSRAVDLSVNEWKKDRERRRGDRKDSWTFYQGPRRSTKKLETNPKTKLCLQ